VERFGSVLIVARPGPLSDGLRAVLASIPRAEVADDLVDEALSLLKAVRQHRPAIVLLDFDLLRRDGPESLQQIKALSPETRCIVLADSVHEQQAAKDAGVDATLLKGSLPATLIATIERLLPQRCQ